MYIHTTDYRSSGAAVAFAASLKETGFAVLSNHPIAPEIIEAVYQDWAAFFSSDTKMDALFDSRSVQQSGYFPFKSEQAKGASVKDLKEFYHYREGHGLPEGMGEATIHLFGAMLALGREVLGWLQAALPASVAQSLSMPLSEMIENSEAHVLRILHYPPLKEDAIEGVIGGAVRAAPHEDINLITILPAATASGLQVQDRQGRWHDVSCDPGTLVFNAGDMLAMATQGFYTSTTHRVVNPVGQEGRSSRYSLPLFVHPRHNVELSPGYTAERYLAERLQELGLFSRDSST